MKIAIPQFVNNIIDELERAGYETYTVGGCVRDALENTEPHDWDVCTAALPEEIKDVLGGIVNIIPTGIAHGTVTVKGDAPDEILELTTFRTDGDYSDGRHPDRVDFVRSIKEDLSRRDFTVNAIAYSPERGVVDPFHGTDDLKAKLLRCVGDPVKRFSEDGLRILRCLRLSAVKGFTVERKTAEAAIECRNMLSSVSWERIDEELLKLLGSPRPGELMDEYRDVFITLIPELKDEVGYDQHSMYHNRDVWHHSLAALDDIPPDMPHLRLVMLLHDIAKPTVGIIDDKGIGRFKKHPQVGAEMAEAILKRMKFPSKFVQRAKTLVLYHDVRVPAERVEVRKFLSSVGEDAFRQILIIQHADGAGKYTKFMKETEERLGKVEELLNSIITDGDCTSLSRLAVSGHDLINAGIPEGKGLRNILNRLLELVMEDKVANNREELLKSVVSVNREK